MVGYVQQIDPDAALAEINGFLDGDGVPALDSEPSPNQGVAQHHHQLNRPFPQSPFRLLHLWRISHP
jgi:hypothetical protein